MSQPSKTWVDRLFTITPLLCFGALFIAIAIPNFISNGRNDPHHRIINNLRQIDGAKEHWAHVNKYTNNVPISEGEIGEYIKGGFPKPIAGERYVIRRSLESPYAVLTEDLKYHPAGTIVRLPSDPEWKLEVTETVDGVSR